MIERWRAVHHGLYAVSDQGRVRRVVLHKSSRPGGFLRARPAANGYRRVSLSIKQRVTYKHVHVLVARAFIGPRPSGYQINHRNGIKADNRARNLEYVTPKGNAQHAIRTGLYDPKLQRRP